MTDITRMDTSARMSRIVIHNQTVYLSGVVPTNDNAGIALQTKNILDQIDTLLAKAGTDKSRLLMAQIWLTNIDRDFAEMNKVWEAWVDPNGIPARATCESKLAREEIVIEITVTAAL